MKWLLVLLLFSGEELQGSRILGGDSKEECEEARAIAAARPEVWVSECIEVKRPPPPKVPLEKQSTDGYSADGKRRGNRT